MKGRATIGDMATVLVGPSAKRYDLHKSVLRSVGGFFKAALNDTGRFREAVTNTITLDDEDTSVFDRFAVYVYMRDFRFDGEAEKAISWKTLINLYTFGERRLLPKMQNKVIQLFAAKIDWDPDVIVPTKILHYLYKNTMDGSPLRSMAVDAYAWNIRMADDKLSPSEHPSGLGLEGSCGIFTDAASTDFPSQFTLEVLKEVIKKAAKLRRTRAFSMVCNEYFVKEDHKIHEYLNPVADENALTMSVVTPYSCSDGLFK